MSAHDGHAIRAEGQVPNGLPRTLTWHGSSVLTQVAVLTRRAVIEYLSDPRAVIIGLIQPFMILYLVVSVFSRVNAHIPGVPSGITYFQYVLPSVLVDSAIQVSLQTGVALIEELRNGVVARLRSLPIQQGTILVARSFSGTVRTGVQTGVLLVLAQLTHGDISRGGLVGMVAAVGLTMLIGWCLGWVFLAFSILLRRAEVMFSLAAVAVLPLMFVSSAWVPVNELPTVLAAIARANPVTYAINAERALLLTTAASSVGAGVILSPILFSGILGAAAATCAVRLFRRPLQLVRP
jgi:ABC-2 type transport system permease protein